MISQYYQDGCLGTFGTDRVGTLGTPTSHPGRPILICKAAELTAKVFARSFTIEKFLPHSESLPLLTQIWSHKMCFSIQWWLTFYNSQKNNTLIDASRFTQVPDFGEMSEAETFLNFISLHPKVSSTAIGSNNRKFQVHHINRHPTTKETVVAPQNNFVFKTSEILILQK